MTSGKRGEVIMVVSGLVVRCKRRCGGGGGEVEEGLVATTWELSQPQGPSQMVVPGANASRKIEFKLEEVPLNSFSGMCLISNSLKKTLTLQSFVEVTVYKGHFMIHSKRGSNGQ